MQCGELCCVLEIIWETELLPQIRAPRWERFFSSSSRIAQCLQRRCRLILPLSFQTFAAFISRCGEACKIICVADFKILHRSRKPLLQFRGQLKVPLVDTFEPQPFSFLVRELEVARLIVESVAPAFAQCSRITADLLPSGVQHLRRAAVRGLDALGFSFEARI